MASRELKEWKIGGRCSFRNCIPQASLHGSLPPFPTDHHKVRCVGICISSCPNFAIWTMGFRVVPNKLR